MNHIVLLLLLALVPREKRKFHAGIQGGGRMRALLSDQYSWVWLRRAAKRTFWISLGILVLLPIIAALVSDSIWTSVLGVFVSIAAWVAALAILSWIVSRIAFWWLKGPIRWGIFTPKIRRAYLLAVFDNTMRQTQIHRLRLVRVIHVYQVNRSGTKCVVEHPEGVRQDAWFWNFSPKRGTYYSEEQHRVRPSQQQRSGDVHRK